MRIQLLCFGLLRDVLGGPSSSYELLHGSTISDLINLLRAQTPDSEAVWSSLAVAVNREYAGLATVLHEGDEVALLPPVSGGLELLREDRDRRQCHPDE